MNRLIFHVDVNSAYLSWEAARRVQQGKEDIRLIASAIGGDRENRTGVILAKSIPAKKKGICTGEPVVKALQKCPDLFVVKPDFRLYEKNSKAFMDICRKYAPAVEKYSIDECFLDMSGTSHSYPDPIKVAYQIKDEIRDTLGFTVNIGIGTNKLLAKMASDFEKPDKVHTLFPQEIAKKMWPLSVRDLFTVGASTANKLQKARIYTIGDLAQRDVREIQMIVGVKNGQHIHAFANGMDDSPVSTEPEESKGYSISTTLKDDIKTTAEAYKILLTLADSVTSRMRVEKAKTYCIGVTIRSNDFKNHSHQKKLEQATDITAEVYQISKILFDELWDQRTPLRLLGISLTNITRENTEQLTLFPDLQKEKERKVDQAMDAIRNRFGSDFIMRGIPGQNTERVGRKYKAQLENRRNSKNETEG